MMLCARCNIDMQEEKYRYKCSKCKFEIKKEILKHKITQEDIDELIKKGETKELEFVSAKTKSTFKTTLVMDNDAVEFKFVRQNKNKKASVTSRKVCLYINSLNIGQVSFCMIINQTRKIYKVVNFGLVSSREAQCLACITAIDYIDYRNANNDNYEIEIIADNEEFVMYALGEINPKDTQVRRCIDQLRYRLKSINKWQMKYQYSGKQKIQGTNIQNIPLGIYPWLKVDIMEIENDMLLIKFPYNLSVITQFKAVFTTAKEDKDNYNLIILENSYREKIGEWIDMVTHED